MLSVEETKRLLEATANLRDRAILSAAYAAGLRLSEVQRLRRVQLFLDDGFRGI